jgi:hypothetical protein
MQMNEYVAQKLRELDNERQHPLLELRMAAESHQRRKTSKPVFGPVLRAAGRTLRRAGEGLEGWGSPEFDEEHRLRRKREPAS